MNIVTLSDHEALVQDKTHAMVHLEHIRLELEMTHSVPTELMIRYEEAVLELDTARQILADFTSKQRKPFWKKLFRK